MKNTPDYLVLVFFCENIKLSLKLLRAVAGLEISGSRFACIPACDSFETGFLDGTLLSFLEPDEPCFFGALLERSMLLTGTFERSAGSFPTTLL